MADLSNSLSVIIRKLDQILNTLKELIALLGKK